MNDTKLPMRSGVGIILLNNENQVFVGKRKDNPGDKWQMPQGGVEDGEDFVAAMRRELYEETNIKNTDYELIENISPIIETFLGENNVKYRNIYYIGICNNTENINIDSNNMDQINEIRDIKIVNKVK